MDSGVFHTALYQPLHNALIFITAHVPYGDVGIAIVTLTLLVRIILLPFSHKAVKSQVEMRKLEPELRAIQEKHKNDRQEQARKTMELYRTRKINPLSGCLPIFIQIPIIFALYYVFLKGLTDMGGLYSFIAPPETIRTHFLGIIDLAGKSGILALIAGVTQYVQMKISMPPSPPKSPGGQTAREEFMRTMTTQMRYILPIMVFFISYTISAAVALYWSTSNLFSIGHEFLVKRNRETPGKA